MRKSLIMNLWCVYIHVRIYTKRWNHIIIKENIKILMFLLIPNYTDGIFRKGSSYGKPNKFDSRCKQRMCLRAARVARMTGFYLTEEHRPPFLELGCEDDRGPRRSIRCPRYDRLSPAQTLAQTKIIKLNIQMCNILYIIYI